MQILSPAIFPIFCFCWHSIWTLYTRRRKTLRFLWCWYVRVFLFFFPCLLLETWLWRDFQGEERNVLGDGETDKDSVWIMHILEHSPLGSSRTWVVNDWQRRPWTVALWGLFIYQCSLPGRLIIRQKSLQRSLFLFSSYKFWTNKITVFSSTA